MDSLYIQGAIRRSVKSPPNLTRNQSSSSNNTERYYLENENIENIYNYYNNGSPGVRLTSSKSSKASSSMNDMSSSSPNLLRRVSSPETSGSDRYLIDRIRGSPAYHSRNSNRIASQIKQDFSDTRYIFNFMIKILI